MELFKSLIQFKLNVDIITGIIAFGLAGLGAIILAVSILRDKWRYR